MGMGMEHMVVSRIITHLRHQDSGVPPRQMSRERWAPGLTVHWLHRRGMISEYACILYSRRGVWYVYVRGIGRVCICR